MTSKKSLINLYKQAKLILLENDVNTKISQVFLLQRQFSDDLCDLSPDHINPELIIRPGSPKDLKFVLPKDLVQRKLTTEAGKIALLHAIAHIEFNAINLALDAVYRYQNMPKAYYSDWLQVAADEAYHFSLLNAELIQRKSYYGELPVHNGLWELAIKTSKNIIHRMALVPRLMEARGLDVTPGIRQKLLSVGEIELSKILAIIERDEVNHVLYGTKWFKYVCELNHFNDPELVYKQILAEYNMISTIKPPINKLARKNSGFSTSEIIWLENQI